MPALETIAARLQFVRQINLQSMFISRPPAVFRFARARPRAVARPSAPPDAALVILDSGGTPSSVPNLSAALKAFVECASRKRAAPRSQFVGVAASGDARSGHACWPGRQVHGRRRLHLPWQVVSCGVAGGSETHSPALTVRQPPNPSVNRRSNGRPLQGKRALSLRGRPLAPSYLER